MFNLSGEKDIAGYKKGQPIHPQLLGLGPNYMEATGAPNRVLDLRTLLCPHVDFLAEDEEAQERFARFQEALQENVKSLKKGRKPDGWSISEIKRVLRIDPKTITKIEGGY